MKTHKQPLISWHVVLYFHARSNLHTHTHTCTRIHGTQGIRRQLLVDELDLGDLKSDPTCEIIISLWVLIHVHSVCKRAMRRLAFVIIDTHYN
uniref:Secreted protein n=1 Tax=Trichogramma kaykai TaxID=54128 RepID=A0ABD2WRD9_9HYME